MKKSSQLGLGGPPMGGAGGGPGQGIAAHPLMSPPPGAMMAGVGGPAMRPAAPTPTKPISPPAPPQSTGGQPPSEQQPEQPQDRMEALRNSLMLLRNVILDLSQKIYQMPLTEEQVRDIAERMIETFTDKCQQITVDRVMDVGHDLVGFTRNKPYKRRD